MRAWVRRRVAVLLAVVRSEGLRGVMRRLSFSFSRVHQFRVLRLELSNALAPDPLPEALIIREVGREELDGMRASRRDMPEYFFRDEAEQLDRCWVGSRAGELGFICWVSYAGSSGMLRLGPRDAELAYIYSMPSFRGNGLTSRAVKLVGQQLRSEGFVSLWAVPNALNIPICRAFERSGFDEVCRVRRYGPITYPRVPIDARSGIMSPLGER